MAFHDFSLHTLPLRPIDPAAAPVMLEVLRPPQSLFRSMSPVAPLELRRWIDSGIRPGSERLLADLRIALEPFVSSVTIAPTQYLKPFQGDPDLQALFLGSAKVLEGTSILTHSGRALAQLERYLWNGNNDVRLLSLVTALHDIGKSLGRSASEQHIFTSRVLSLIRPGLPIYDRTFQHLYALCTTDPIGACLMSITRSTFWRSTDRGTLWSAVRLGELAYETLREAMTRGQPTLVPGADVPNALSRVEQVMRNRADVLGISPSAVLLTQLQFYQMDTTSYTLEAGSLPMFERLYALPPERSIGAANPMFIWDSVRERLTFAPLIEELVLELERRCTQ